MVNIKTQNTYKNITNVDIIGCIITGIEYISASNLYDKHMPNEMKTTPCNKYVYTSIE